VGETFCRGMVLLLLGSGLVHAEQGEDALMGMRIEKLVQENGSTTILTTVQNLLSSRSARCNAGSGSPSERKVLEVKLPKAAGPLRVEKKNDFVCTVCWDGASLRVQGDSVVIFKFDKETAVSFRGLFRPAYHAEQDGKWLMIDPAGGFGVYPVTAHKTNTPDFASESWQIDYNFNAKEEAWLSVFPPRPYNWRRSFESIEHEGGDGMDVYPATSHQIGQSLLPDLRGAFPNLAGRR